MADYKYDVFISYSRKDTKVANEIIKVFENEGISYFIDRQGIGGGMEFPLVLAKAIKEAKVFLFLASKNSYDSKFTQSEIVYAFNKKQKQDIIPYIIDGSSLPEELEFTFSAINWRRIEEHPISTVLVDDILRRVGRERLQHVASTPAEGLHNQAVSDDSTLSEDSRSNSSKSLLDKFLPYEFTGLITARVILGTSICLLLITLLLSKLNESFFYNHEVLFDLITILPLFILLATSLVGLIRPKSLCLDNRKDIFKYYISAVVILFVTFGIGSSYQSVKNEQNENGSEGNPTESSELQSVDLGLPSGTLWADRNIGAMKYYDFGDLYAWGEITLKEDYSQSNYDISDKPEEYITSKKYDVCTNLLGEMWSLPSEEQFQELIDECQWTWTQIKGHNGFLVKGKNGNTIFLPAAGWNHSKEVEFRNNYGYYWTSQRNKSNTAFGRGLLFPKNSSGIVGNGYLHYGRSIRPVYIPMAFAD